MTNEELDVARAKKAAEIWDPSNGTLATTAARLAREGWTPPVAVDPDHAIACELAKEWDLRGLAPECWNYQALALVAIKRGRELERDKADIEIDQLQETVMELTKPGMVWIKHDGSRQSPVPGALVTVSLGHSHYQTDVSFMIDWWMVSYYAIITQPEKK